MTTAAPLEYPLHEHTLGNGLRVVISPDHAVPFVAVNLWYDVGSRDEQPGRTGLAHLFEHVMFQGSENVASGEHFN
ncbi:MAG TPA: insulinase family protein, partial [Propionibacterium sp.]|nr:insulinase family protein [Propionibacterium sp.]